MGLLKVTGVIMGCNLLVGIQLGQLGRFGRLIYRIGELLHIVFSNDGLQCKTACAGERWQRALKRLHTALLSLPSRASQ